MYLSRQDHLFYNPRADGSAPHPSPLSDVYPWVSDPEPEEPICISPAAVDRVLEPIAPARRTEETDEEEEKEILTAVSVRIG